MVEVLNAVAAVGPVGLLAFVILLAMWQFGPIAKDFVSKIGLRLDANTQTLQAVKDELTEEKKAARASERVIGELAANNADLQSAVGQMADATKSLNQAMEKSIEFERNRHLSLIGGISQVVTSVGDMSKALEEDIKELHTLIETRPKAMDENEVGWFKTNVEAIRDCVLRIEVKLMSTPAVATPAPLSVVIPQPVAAVQPTESIELVKEVQP